MTRKPCASAHTINFEEIARTEQRLLRAQRSTNTRKAYRSGWKAFCHFCAAAAREPLPAAAATLKDFAVWSIAGGYRLNTVVLRVSAVNFYHREAGHDAPVDNSVRELLQGARRELKERPRGKRALTYSLLEQVIARCPDRPIGDRNRAMILLGFATGWRRSEIVALQRSDIEIDDRGLQLFQRSSKTDQVGKGRFVGIRFGTRRHTCPVLALRKWLDQRGDWDGPLFVRFSNQLLTREGLEPRGEALHWALKAALSEVGENPSDYGAHSLRAGMITEAALHGAGDSAIAARTGHRSTRTIQQYIRPANIFDFDPLAAVL